MNRWRGFPCAALALLLLVALAGPAAADVSGVTASPNPAPVNADVTVTVTAPSGGGFGGADCSQVRVAYGDGSTDTSAAGSSPFVFHHKYTTAGGKTLTATGVGPCPGTKTASLTVLVAPAPPTGGGKVPAGMVARQQLCALTIRGCPPPAIGLLSPLSHIQPGGVVLVVGQNFGPGPGQFLFKFGSTVFRLENLGWSDFFVAGTIPLAVGEWLTTGTAAKLQIVAADGKASNEWPTTLRTATLEMLPSQDVNAACSGGADINGCNDWGPPRPSLSGIHLSSTGVDGGVDEFSFDLKNGWVVDSWDVKNYSSDPCVTLFKMEGLYHGAGGRVTVRVPWNLDARHVDACLVDYGAWIYIRGPLGTAW